MKYYVRVFFHVNLIHGPVIRGAAAASSAVDATAATTYE